jgi:hypothetical protein
MRLAPEGGTLYTVSPAGDIVPAPVQSAPTVTQSQVDASLAANPQAAGSNGTLFTYSGVGTPSNPGPAGQTSYSTPAAAAPAPPVDYSSFLGIYGLPGDVANKINQIFQQNSDVNQATAIAMAYVRGTPWYTQTYPGIQEGIAKGVVSNEADYRAYVNNIQGLTKQFYNRDASATDIAGYLASGFTIGHVQNLFQADANFAADRGQVPAGLFTDAELHSIANGQAGIGDQNSQDLAARFGYAQSINNVYRTHFGRDITRGELNSQFAAGVTPDIADRTFTGQSYIAANRNDIQAASGAFGEGRLDDAALAALGNQTAGLDTTQGQIIQAAYQKALQRLHGAFQGVLANPSLSLGPNGLSAPSLAGQRNGMPDTGA